MQDDRQLQQQQEKQNINPIQQTFNKQQTMKCLYTQLRIMRKVIKSIYWKRIETFPKYILYVISTYVFCNPIKLITPIYKQINPHKIKQQNSYMVVNQWQRHQSKQVNCKTYSITIKVLKVWNMINVNQNDLNTIIIKSKHLMNFLKGIKINHPKQSNSIPEEDFNYHNIKWQKSSKSYTLICENYDYIYQKITQIQANHKTHKIDQLILKAYLEIIRRNMIVVSVYANTHSSHELASQGKFICLQNSLQLPLKSRKFEDHYQNLQSYKINQKLKLPYLSFKNNQWFIQWEYQIFQVYEGLRKKLNRGKGNVINFKSQKYFYDDFSIQPYDIPNQKS